MHTVERLAAAAGLQATIAFTTPLTREDRRSLELHRALARRLMDDPDAVIARARHNLARMRARGGQAAQLLREGGVILDRPVTAIVALLADPGEWARELRHVTPFAGVLSARERAAAYRRFAHRGRGSP